MARHAGRRDFSARLIVSELPRRASGRWCSEAVAAASGVSGRRAQGGNVRRRRGRSRAGAAAGGSRRLGASISSCSRCCRCCRNRRQCRGGAGGAGTAALEWKIDGARAGPRRRRRAGYTRNLNDVTQRVPEIATRCASARRSLIRRRAIALRPDGTPLSFQLTCSASGSKLTSQ